MNWIQCSDHALANAEFLNFSRRLVASVLKEYNASESGSVSVFGLRDGKAHTFRFAKKSQSQSFDPLRYKNRNGNFLIQPKRKQETWKEYVRRMNGTQVPEQTAAYKMCGKSDTRRCTKGWEES
jgi:hypothetical protein